MDNKGILYRWTGLTTIALTLSALVSGWSFAGSAPASVKVSFVSPVPGHWLQTDYLQLRPISRWEQEYNKAQVELSKRRIHPVLGQANEVMPQEVILHKNKQLANTNIIFFWTDANRLKVITLLSLNSQGKKAGVLHLPLYTKIRYGQTLQDIFLEAKGDGIIEALAEKLEMPIQYFVDMDQRVLLDFSETLGPIRIGKEDILVADAFAQTSTGQRSDDQEVVRSLLSKLIQPGTLLKVPKMVWIFTRQVDTNLDSSAALKLFEVSRQAGRENLSKISIPGANAVEDGRQIREVPERVWKSIIYDLTT